MPRQNPRCSASWCWSVCCAVRMISGGDENLDRQVFAILKQMADDVQVPVRARCIWVQGLASLSIILQLGGWL